MFKKFYIYPLAPGHSNASPTFYKPLKNNSQSYAQTKIKPFYCTKFVIAPVKGFYLVREMQERTTVSFISQEKDKEHSQKYKENMFLKTYFIRTVRHWFYPF